MHREKNYNSANLLAAVLTFNGDIKALCTKKWKLIKVEMLKNRQTSKNQLSKLLACCVIDNGIKVGRSILYKINRIQLIL